MLGMNETEKTDILLEKLKVDSEEYKGLETKEYSLVEKKNAIRSLMNIRMPGKLSSELVDLQDGYLQEERKAKEIVRLADIPTIKEQFNSKVFHAEKMSLCRDLESCYENVLKCCLEHHIKSAGKTG